MFEKECLSLRLIVEETFGVKIPKRKSTFVFRYQFAGIRLQLKYLPDGQGELVFDEFAEGNNTLMRLIKKLDEFNQSGVTFAEELNTWKSVGDNYKTRTGLCKIIRWRNR